MSDENHELVQEKLKNLDKNKVDRYPVFAECESLEGDVLAEKECFIKMLSEHIASNVLTDEIILEKPLNDEFQVYVEIDTIGAIQIIKSTTSDSLRMLIPTIDHKIKESLLTLPKIEPAMKALPSTEDRVKGEEVPVSIQFLIPIKVVSVQE